MNGKERILTALRLEKPDRIPTFEWFIDEGVGLELTGSRDPVEIVDALDVDGINIRVDYKKQSIDDETFSDEWGSVRKLTGDAIPAIIQYPIKDIADQASYEFPDLNAPGRFKTIERAMDKFGDSRAVILNIRDGFSDMRDLLGYENALVNMMVEPEAFTELLKRVVEYNLKAARICRERYGLEVIGTTDDVANGDGLLMSPDTYYEMLGPAFKELIGGYKSLGYKTVKHCDGDVRPLVDSCLGQV
jgi:uroporphyrinogen decarboxylase